MLTWLSCEKYAESASRRLDQDLSLHEKLRYLFHHVICFYCRRFSKQLSFLNQALEKLPEQFEEQAEHENCEGLSPESCKRIQLAINNAKS